jgi:hypothetical protein
MRPADDYPTYGMTEITPFRFPVPLPLTSLYNYFRCGGENRVGSWYICYSLHYHNFLSSPTHQAIQLGGEQ